MNEEEYQKFVNGQRMLGVGYVKMLGILAEVEVANYLSRPLLLDALGIDR